MDERARTVRSVPLRRLFERTKVLGHTDEPMLSVYREQGVVPKDEAVNHNKTAEDRSIYQLVDDGWLVVNRMKAWQGAVAISSLRGILSGHYICFRPIHEENDRFLHYLLRSPKMTAHFLSISRGVRPGQIEIDNDDLAATQLSLPDVHEQRRIAEFLDSRIADLDQIMAARRDQIVASGGLRVARIQHLQDELVSSHGETRLSHVIDGLEQGWSPQADSIPATPSEWGVMRSGCVNGGVFKPDDNKRLPVDLQPRKEYEIRAGDLLMSRASGSLDLIGSVAVVPAGVRSRLLLCDKVYRILPTRGWSAEFLAHMLRTRRSREQIRIGVSGAEGMANNLPSGVVRDLRVPMLTPEDQLKAVKRADEHVEVEASVVGGLHRSIALLGEYKSSLITAAVTGEVDVTTTKGGIPG